MPAANKEGCYIPLDEIVEFLGGIPAPETTMYLLVTNLSSEGEENWVIDQYQTKESFPTEHKEGSVSAEYFEGQFRILNIY